MRHYFIQFTLFIVLILLASNAWGNEASTASSRTVMQLQIDGAIGPATDDYVGRALKRAESRSIELVIIRMDTPGGLDLSMRSMIKNITNSSIPIATFVAPTGSRAASAGTYILYASHIAAMAPGTNLGAATPVQIGGISPQDLKDKYQDNKEPEIKPKQDPMKQKIVNDAVAFIRGLANLHGRNQEWAEQAVREAASLPASEALKKNVIDILAINNDDLLKQINGREVQVLKQSRRINTSQVQIETYEPDWRNRLLSVITNPNIAYMLMLVGIYGLIFEFSNPGAILPGTVGAISLLVALYAFQLLPVNYAGVGLILLGLALIIAEAFQPSFGVLGIGGLISFVFGSIILMDTDAPGFGISPSIILSFAMASGLLLFIVIGMALKARTRPVVTGLEEMIGMQAIVLNDFERRGKVIFHSEVWNATSSVPLYKDQVVRIIHIDGLTVRVEPITKTG